ncbi:MAG TPA: DHCW motif cupin fold protein [Puia sp.]|jgi:quercetin dioxygenase-like cupin family protein
MKKISFQTIDWSQITKTEKPGETGCSFSRTIEYPELRIRMVEYSDGYLADHWCQKGHVVYCLEGELLNEQENGEQFILKQGMSYVVSDNMSSHRSRTENKVKLLIVDGDFLKSD